MRAWFGQVELPAADPRRLASFYAEVFGWEAREPAAEPGEAGKSGPALKSRAAVKLNAAGEGREAGEDGERREPGETAAYVSLRPRHPASPAAGGGVAAPQVLGSTTPLAVIHVEGAPLREVLTRVEAAGGATDLPPTGVGRHGTFARFTDPAGNLLGLWATRAPGPTAAR